MAPLAKLSLFLAAFVADAAWSPANGTKELDAVEAALHAIVDNPKLSPSQMKMAKKTVADVDQIVAQIQNAKGLTKQAKMQKVGQALGELQDLQGQFELNTVQQALHKMEHGHLTNEVAKSAKEVAQAVDKVAEELEAGKGLTKEQKNKMVAGAIQKLQGLQGLFEKSLEVSGNHTMSMKLETLEKELALKKTELARSEDMLKLAKLQKELALKKEQLRELESKKASSKAGALAEEKEKKEQAEMVAKLVGMAKELKATKGAKKEAPSAKLPAPIQDILTNLQAKAAGVASQLAKMDTEEAGREKKADDAAAEASHNKDAAKGKKLSSMLKFLAKEEKHTYQKLRAAKARNLKELNEAIYGIQTGDAATVQKVMQEMQHDVKSFETKSHNFLY